MWRGCARLRWRQQVYLPGHLDQSRKSCLWSPGQTLGVHLKDKQHIRETPRRARTCGSLVYSWVAPLAQKANCGNLLPHTKAVILADSTPLASQRQHSSRVTGNPEVDRHEGSRRITSALPTIRNLIPH